MRFEQRHVSQNERNDCGIPQRPRAETPSLSRYEQGEGGEGGRGERDRNNALALSLTRLVKAFFELVRYLIPKTGFVSYEVISTSDPVQVLPRSCPDLPQIPPRIQSQSESVHGSSCGGVRAPHLALSTLGARSEHALSML